MQNKDYLSALAWFKLVGLKMIDNDPDSKRQQLQILSDQLKDTYGKLASLGCREHWQKSISFGGTKIKGHIPNNIKIYPSGQVSRLPNGNVDILVSSAVVTGEVVSV